MRTDPGLDTIAIAAVLRRHYGLDAAAVVHLPLGLDLNVAAYRVTAEDRTEYFLKIRFDSVAGPALLVLRALQDGGVPNILAPLSTRQGDLSVPLPSSSAASLALYPYIRGDNAMSRGLTADQWRTFGATLRAVHDSGLGHRFRDQLPVEAFALPAAALVRRMLSLPASEHVAGIAAARFAAWWRAHAERIARLLDQAETLAAVLRARAFPLVLCHADIHAANILVGDDGAIHLADWDGPLSAPIERDLLFVVGSRIARSVAPHDEDWFFAGYGPCRIDPAALVYFRLERILDDLGVFAHDVLSRPALSESERAAHADLAMTFFAPAGIVDRAESVPRVHWPT